MDLSYSVYYTFSSSATYGQTTETGGAGFGMINSNDDRPWYPYYVQQMIGYNLRVGDQLLNVSSSSEDIRVLAWTHHEILTQTLFMLLICRVDEKRIVYQQSVAGRARLISIDNGISWTTPLIRKELVNSREPIVMNGYSVALLTLTTLSWPSFQLSAISPLQIDAAYLVLTTVWNVPKRLAAGLLNRH